VQIDDIAVKKGLPCPVYTPPKPEPEKPDPEKEAYDRADGFARSRSCGALECLTDYRRRYPNGRYKAQIEQITQLPKAAPCPDLDRGNVPSAAQVRCHATSVAAWSNTDATSRRESTAR